MRLWSISPKYLDTKGLVAVWREGLLAKCVLEGKTKGYKNHPQLIRFKEYKKPLIAINSFLCFVAHESQSRGFNFDVSKLDLVNPVKAAIPVTHSQLMYEFAHLCKKLKIRSSKRYELFCPNKVDNISPNPLFFIIQGDIEVSERVK
ncbi:MAG: hypothetical protein FXF54_02990 [Kosmotoga sp.]|nr:MAG: hypothetical protein FXF54_02990 [Kosmotoga sp.]